MSSVNSSCGNALVFHTGHNCLPKNFIEDGMKVSLDSGLNVKVSTGMCDIQGRYHEIEEELFQSLEPRSTLIMYAQFAQNALCPKLGYTKAVYPTDMIDDNTVGFWVFNKTGNIPNSAVGKSAIAVANDLVPHGGLTQVDGHCDYAIQGDGSTGYYVSQNSNGFPVGTNEKEASIMYTHTKLHTTQAQKLFMYGGASNDTRYCIGINTNSNTLIFDWYGSVTSTGYDLEIGKTYSITVLHNNGYLYLYVNGSLVYQIAKTLNVSNSIMTIGSVYTYGIIHFLELRNKCRTPAQIASIANKLCLPCSYTAPSASYPTISATDLASAYHEYKFDETSGTAVTDSAGTLNGTATGTTIVDSEIGLGKARKFNGTSDKITCGNYQFPNNYTILGVATKSAIVSVDRAIIGNYNGTDGVIIGIRSGDVSGNAEKFFIFKGSTYYYSNAIFPQNVPTFYATVVNSTLSMASVYLGSPYPDNVFPFVPDTIVNNTLQIGCYSSTAYFNGNIDYLAIIPRALSQAEIAQYYSTLMNTEKKDIRSILPTDAISLGRVRTDSSNVIEINDDYMYGRREKAVAGNRKKFLGWKYFSGGTTLTWGNPFGTRKIKTYYTWAQDANGTNESDTISMFINTNPFGLSNENTTSQRIVCGTKQGGTCYFNGVWQTSGYIGCYCEVLDD